MPMLHSTMKYYSIFVSCYYLLHNLNSFHISSDRNLLVYLPALCPKVLINLCGCLGVPPANNASVTVFDPILSIL